MCKRLQPVGYTVCKVGLVRCLTLESVTTNTTVAGLQDGRTLKTFSLSHTHTHATLVCVCVFVCVCVCVYVYVYVYVYVCLMERTFSTVRPCLLNEGAFYICIQRMVPFTFLYSSILGDGPRIDIFSPRKTSPQLMFVGGRVGVHRECDEEHVLPTGCLCLSERGCLLFKPHICWRASRIVGCYYQRFCYQLY